MKFVLHSLQMFPGDVPGWKGQVKDSREELTGNVSPFA